MTNTKFPELFKKYQKISRFNEPLAKYTSFKLGGPADVFITPQTIVELSEIYQLCLKESLPVYFLGGGTNLLVKDEGVKGVVVSITFDRLVVKDEAVLVESGYSLNNLIIFLIKAGLGGLESLAGVPGSVGGAVMMNAGGHHGTIGEFVESVIALDKNGKLKPVEKDQINFGYRATEIKDSVCIVKMILRLKKTDPVVLKEKFQEILKAKGQSQPLGGKNAGCVFKNPLDQSAGALIDQAGLKGLTVGGAKVSEQHANFIINTGSATAQDVLSLMEQIKKTVAEQFKVELEPEIKIW